jgi:hypothetical protein
MAKCFYFGCWNRAGHYLFLPGGGGAHSDSDGGIVNYGPPDPAEKYYPRAHLDGTLAPRKGKRGTHLHGVALCWQGQGETVERRSRIGYDSEEYPQGQFLVHQLDNGYTAMQWWDRCQGDTRGACNSTVLLEGKHETAEMLAALACHFPHVVENLSRAGISLVEVPR